MERLTLMETLHRATDYLARHGSSSARLDAELLLAHSLDLRRLDLYLQHERQLQEPQLSGYRELIRRRGQGEPVAYLTGRKEFMALDFEVTPAVLIPNPDTEVLVQRAIAWARERDHDRIDFADVGTGSGCIAVSIAHYVPQARVFATELDPAASEVARRNIAHHSLEDRVMVATGDLLEPLPKQLDAICANLPYIAAGTRLEAEVVAQPAGALFAGSQGSEVVARLLQEGRERLRPGGIVLAEIDERNLAALEPLAQRLYSSHQVQRDLGGHPRLLEVRA